jgi:hypothetical protein
MRDAGLEQTRLADDDERLWARQRDAQRSSAKALLRVAARPSRLADVLALTDACGAGMVGRAGLGTSYIECDPGTVSRLRRSLPAGAAAVVLDGPRELDRWEVRDGTAIELMRRVKGRFDPTRACNPGVFVGGI